MNGIAVITSGIVIVVHLLLYVKYLELVTSVIVAHYHNALKHNGLIKTSIDIEKQLSTLRQAPLPYQHLHIRGARARRRE